VSETGQRESSVESTLNVTDLFHLLPVLGTGHSFITTLESDNQRLRSEVQQWKTEAQRLAQVLERLKFQQQTPRENVDPNQIQLAFDKLAADLLKHLAKPEAQELTGTPDAEQPPAKPRKHTPHGRGILPENLPTDTIVITPKNLPEGAQLIGEDVSYKLSYRRGSFRRLKIVRPRYALPSEFVGQCDGDEVQFFENTSFSALGTSVTIPEACSVPAQPSAVEPVESESTGVSTHPAESASVEQVEVEASLTAQGAPSGRGQTTVIQSNIPADVIPRGLPTVDLLANILVGKFADKLPFNRQQGIFGRTGTSITRTVMCQWTEAVSEKVRPLIAEMERDAREHADVIYTDSTGILVQDKQRCKKGSFWVYVSNNGHIIFRYASDGSGDEPKRFFAGFRGIVVADATATLDAIIGTFDGPSDRAGCYSHARRYFFKALETERDLALIGVGMVNRIFELERPWAKLPPAQRLSLRQTQCAPVFEALLGWAKEQFPRAEHGSRLYKALFYFINNERELRCFLRDGKVALTNNVSERQLRALVTGRANWMFIGGDHTGPWTANLSSLMGSCALNLLDPESYIRDLLRVLPYWPKDRLLELCPRDWTATRARLDPVELALPLGPLTIPPIASRP